ncbi:MAG TPA: flagellar biosynthetic protein FliO [Myxococcaceae bacterium]|nr:flagellar biosynthetic protein FliO [Myxococcaceae bacterium]
MSLAVVLRRPAELLAPLAGAALMLLVLGPNLRGGAAAVLAAAATLALRLRARLSAPAEPRPVRVLERLQLGPRLTVVLVETAGRRYLVTTGATVTPLPLEDGP